MERSQLSHTGSGSKDGSGAADNDQPYTFGRRPRAVAPWPFTERQFAHLLMLRGRVGDAADPADRFDAPTLTLVRDEARPLAPTELPRKPRRRAA